MFRRRAPGDTAERPPAEAAPQPAQPGGKGRPTPKRREAEQTRRQAVRAPRDRKEAYRQTRARARDERRQMREALVRGDERNLPPRDRGPVRAHARDFVDGRRCVAEYFLPSAVVMLVLITLPVPVLKAIGNLIWLMMIVLITLDSVVIARRLRAQVRERFPEENSKGVTAYALLRSMQIRRLRLPPPRVKPGRVR